MGKFPLGQNTSVFQQFVVRTAGLEPARPYGLEILSLLRLPFRQVRLGHNPVGGLCVVGV